MFDGARNIQELAGRLAQALATADSERYTGDLKLAHVEAISVLLDELQREIAMMDDVCRAVLDLAREIRKGGDGGDGKG